MASIKNSTQAHLDILEIKQNTIILRNHSAAYILETNAVNFDLLSGLEKDAAISSYSALLNSLTFPIQVTLRTKRLDISDYLNSVQEQEVKARSQEVRNQIRAYRLFIQEELITRRDVLEKKFYVTIPYGDFGISNGDPFDFFSKILSFGSTDTTRFNIDRVLQDAQKDLEPKKDFLVKEFRRVGLTAKHLNTQELTELFYEIYNSETARAQRIQGSVSNYSTALVEQMKK